MDTIIDMRHVGKAYPTGDHTVHALQDVCFTVKKGEMVAILGPSGSGKSTLMNLLGCLDTPSEGEYHLNGHRVSGLSEQELSDIRNRTVGFIFQGFHLLPGLTALENAELPLLYRGVEEKARRAAAVRCLEQVGLGDRLHHLPSQLSGGQQQRVAIARAMVGQPPMLLADEPTGNLDTASGREVMGLLKELHGRGHTVVLITHDPRIGEACPRRVVIEDGKLRES